MAFYIKKNHTVLCMILYSWDSMIRSYCEAGFRGKAYELLVKMQESDVILYKRLF